MIAGLESNAQIVRVYAAKEWSREWELNPRPVDYEMSAFALSLLFSIDAILSLSPCFYPFSGVVCNELCNAERLASDADMCYRSNP